jgi:hypothetical protein
MASKKKYKEQPIGAKPSKDAKKIAALIKQRWYSFCI